jgi:GMP synthase-like glutamine amidotransferase
MIGLLNAYHFDDDPNSYQRRYGPMFLDFLKTALPGEEIRVYTAGRGELPGAPAECDGWICGGSAKSAYDEDPWIKKLGGFVAKIHEEKRKYVGICFGHQLAAHYLGGRTE